MNQKICHIQSVHSDTDNFYLTVNGQSYRLPWTNCSARLATASPLERGYVEISPSGYGLHWPLIDEDLAVLPLLKLAEKLSTEFA